MLNNLTAGSAVPDRLLSLKVGFPVLLIRSINPHQSHVNGARYVVRAVQPNLLFLESLTGDNIGRLFALPKMPCSPGDKNFPIQGFTGTQFLVRVYFSVTINTAQEQSFYGTVGLDLMDPFFLNSHL